MKRFAYLLLAPLLLLGLTACGSTTESNSSGSKVKPGSLLWSMELWGDNFVATSSGHCTESDSRTNYEHAAPISLVGPDDAVISSATMDSGVLRKSAIEEAEVTNFPSGNICYFAVTFKNVPVVDTYRVKTGDQRISPVTHALADVKSSNWKIGEVIGADFKE